MGQQRYSTEKTRKDIYEGEYFRALVQISTDLESLFFDKLFFEKGIVPELMEGWTLGRYTTWVFKNKLVDVKYESTIKDFLKVRNAIIHTRYGIHNATSDLKKLNFLASLMIRVCNFLDDTWVERKHDNGYEEKYTEIISKTAEKYNKAFGKIKWS